MRRSFAACVAPLLFGIAATAALAAPAQAPASTAAGVSDQQQSSKVLDARDHAELRAEIQKDGLVRVALLRDRIARVIHGPDVSFGVEHDTRAGDIYLRWLPQSAETAESFEPAAQLAPEKLFIGSERGFTYALSLTPVAGGAAQLLIRNPAIDNPGEPSAAMGGDAHVSEIADLLRAVVSRKPPPGFWVEPGGRETVSPPGATLLESWRGPRWEVLVLSLAISARRTPGTHAADGAADLAARFGPGVLAAWIDEAAAPGPRLAVIVRRKPQEQAMREGEDHVGR